MRLDKYKKYDVEILVDPHGRIRIPDYRVDNTKAEQHAKKIVDELFMATGKVWGVKTLDVSLSDYDDVNGNKRRRTAIAWSDEEMVEFLRNYSMENEELAKHLEDTFGVQRSPQAIKMRYDLRRPFEQWKEQNRDMIEGLTHKEVVDLYVEERKGRLTETL